MSTIATLFPIQSGEDSRVDINNNFSALNTGKAEISGQVFTGVIVASNLSGTNTGDQTITLTGDVAGTGTGGVSTTLASSGVTAGVYGSASLVPILTVDAKGRVTSATTTTITSGSITLAGDVTGLVSTTSVDKIKGTPVTLTSLTTNNLLQYNGTAFVNVAPSALGIITTNVAEGTNLYYTNARGIGSTLTGFISGAGTVSSADTILGAIQKLNGNNILKANAGSNSDITSLTGLTTALSVAQGGTGSITRNFVDLTSTETVGGGKTFLSVLTGTAGATITGAIALNVSGTAQTQIGNGSTGAVFIGSGNNVQQISMAESGTKTVTLGSTGTTSSMLIQAGTNPVIQSTQQPATGVVQRISNTIDTVDTFITNTTPQGAITASIGDTAYDNTSAIQYYKGSGTATQTGWEHIPSEQYFRLTATGTAITTTATNFFGATSGIGLVANGYYEIEATLYFLKTTNGAVTFTILNSAAPTSMNVHVETTPNSGIAAAGQNSNLVADFYNSTSATQTFASGGNLTGGVNHYARFKIFLRNGTGTSLNFQISTAAGSVTPGIGSYWKARKLPDNSVGNLV